MEDSVWRDFFDIRAPRHMTEPLTEVIVAEVDLLPILHNAFMCLRTGAPFELTAPDATLIRG